MGKYAFAVSVRKQLQNEDDYSKQDDVRSWPFSDYFQVTIKNVNSLSYSRVSRAFTEHECSNNLSTLVKKKKHPAQANKSQVARSLAPIKMSCTSTVAAYLS